MGVLSQTCRFRSTARGLGVVSSMLAAVACAVATPQAQAQDFGDHTSVTLTGKAWQALADGKHDLVTAYTAKCRDMYEGEAIKQQASLSDFAPADKAHSYWALNDVGTCLFIEGQLREKQQKPKEAIAAYKPLVEELTYCQCWDTKGWFWKPAEAAAGRIKELEFDATLE